MRAATDYLDIDIWLAQLCDGRVLAYSHDEPRFLTAAAGLDDVIAESRCALREHGTASGHDLRFGLRPSYRPRGLTAMPRESLPVPMAGLSILGRLVVESVSGAGPLPTDPLGDFLSREAAPPARRRRG